MELLTQIGPAARITLPKVLSERLSRLAPCTREPPTDAKSRSPGSSNDAVTHMTHDFETCVICVTCVIRGEEEAGTLVDENAQRPFLGSGEGPLITGGHCRAGAGSGAHWGIGCQRLLPPDGREPAGIPPEVELNDDVEDI
jgi:hypothetical protein